MTAAAVPDRVVQVRPAPRREPPFDDERPARHLALVGPHDSPLPFAPAGPTPRLLRPIAPDLEGLELPDAQAFGRRLLIAIFETLAGRRSVRQLAPHLSHRVYAHLCGDLERGVRPGWRQAPTIRSVRASYPAPGVSELAVVVDSGQRVRAVAARLEALDGRWRCVRLQLG